MDSAIAETLLGVFPDTQLLERHRGCPEAGPRVVLFGGGSATRQFSRALARYTHNSIHLITPFDSGGSSAKLREEFRMIAVGDLRNRLIALSDESVDGHERVAALFSHRLPKNLGRDELFGTLDRMIEGGDPLVSSVPSRVREVVVGHLEVFRREVSGDFDLTGASLGNLVLTGGYLKHGRKIEPVLSELSELLHARGVIRPTTCEDLHLVTALENGRLLVGQHLLTGKEVPAIESPVERVFVTRDRNHPKPKQLRLAEPLAELIAGAEVICYPMGSFYSSLIASILPRGVGRAVASADATKVYVPNTGEDPEQLGMGLADSVERLIAYLMVGLETEVSSVLRYVLLDSAVFRRLGGQDLRRIEAWGVEVVCTPLSTKSSRPLLDGARLVEAILSLG